MTLHGMEHAWRASMGARDYIEQHPDLRQIALPQKEKHFQTIERYQVDGVIGFWDSHNHPAVNALGIPAVSYSSRVADQITSVMPDNHAIGVMGARHLVEAGCSRFMFVSYWDNRVAQERFTGFREELARQDRQATWYIWKSGSRQEEAKVLDELTQPTGVMAFDDGPAYRISELAGLHEIPIPEHLAMVSVNNAQRVCELATTPISSIDLNSERIGWEAAEVLHRKMLGKPAYNRIIPPLGVEPRASSQPSAIDDPPVQQALEFIQRYACEGATIHDLMEALDISRRTLEKRFQSRFGRTLNSEVMRVRMAQAKRLLRHTQLRVTDIALRCGYANHGAFTYAFTKQEGQPPSAFRKHTRSGSATPRS